MLFPVEIYRLVFWGAGPLLSTYRQGKIRLCKWNGFRSYLKSILEVFFMNVRFFKLITLLITFFVISLQTISIKAIIPQISARPVVFITLRKILYPIDQDQVSGSIEMDELRKQRSKLNKKQQNGINTNEEMSELWKAENALRDKTMVLAFSIGKEVNACAVLEYGRTGYEEYIDPAYDISDKVLDRLNQEYFESHQAEIEL